MAGKLPDQDIQRALDALPGWTRRGDTLTKTFTFERFAQGIRFVNTIADAADRMDHHPDIDIRYTKITFTLSSHDAGGITQRDVSLAKEIETAAGSAQGLTG